MISQKIYFPGVLCPYRLDFVAERAKPGQTTTQYMYPMRKNCFLTTKTQVLAAAKTQVLMAAKTQVLLAVILLMAVFASGCTPQRKLIYLQDKSASRGGPDTMVHPVAPHEKATPPEGSSKHHPDSDDTIAPPTDTHKKTSTRADPAEYRLQPGDILHVRVLTSDPYSPEVINSFDIRRYTKGSGDVGNPDMYLHGHSINLAGYIHLPMVGDVHVAGRTIEEAQEIIREKTTAFLLDAVVSVKLVNFSVTILGEVRRPGTYYLYDHNLTIMDAIGMAGDLTDYGRRQIHIIRQDPGGPVFAKIDITDRRALDSELFYLHPNDLIYVEPHTTKRFGFSQFPFAVVFSAISTGLLLINFFN